MEVVYDGPHAEVDVPDAGIEAAKRGDKIEVPDDVGRNLIAQAYWSTVETPAQRAKREQAEKDADEQDKAADKAAAEARKTVAAEQAKRRNGGN